MEPGAVIGLPVADSTWTVIVGQKHTSQVTPTLSGVNLLQIPNSLDKEPINNSNLCSSVVLSLSHHGGMEGPRSNR